MSLDITKKVMENISGYIAEIDRSISHLSDRRAELVNDLQQHCYHPNIINNKCIYCNSILEQ